MKKLFLFLKTWEPTRWWEGLLLYLMGYIFILLIAGAGAYILALIFGVIYYLFTGEWPLGNWMNLLDLPRR